MLELIDEPRCEICKFHELTPVGSHGRCYRFPPIPHAGWVSTLPTDWCGEFQLDVAKLNALKKKAAEEKAA